MVTNKSGYWKEWYHKNKTRIRPIRNEQNNRLRRLNPETYRGYRKKHYEQHRESLCLISKQYSNATRSILVTILGNVCVKCGTTENVEIDHIQAGGTLDRIVKGGSNRSLYLYYIKNPTEAKHKLQLLCRKHNQEKIFLNLEKKPKDIRGRMCGVCNSEKSDERPTKYFAYSHYVWYKNPNGGWLCRRCYQRDYYGNRRRA